MYSCKSHGVALVLIHASCRIDRPALISPRCLEQHVGYTADEESLLVSIYKAKTAKRRNGDGEDLWENVSIAFNKQVLSERWERNT